MGGWHGDSFHREGLIAREYRTPSVPKGREVVALVGIAVASRSGNESNARVMEAPGRQVLKTDEPPIILLPGMAADARLFRLQRAALSGLVTPDWIEPRGREPLGVYA